MLNNKYIALALFVSTVLGFWNLYQFVYSLLVTRSGYHFILARDLIFPVVVGLIVGYFQIMRNDR